MTWRDWPAARQRWLAAFAVAVILACAAVVTPISPLMAVVGTVALVVSTAEFLLPTRYTVDEAGVKALGLLRRREHPWSHFAAFSRRPGALALRGAGPAAIIARRRDLVLRCPGQEPAVAALIAAHVPEAA